MLQADTASLNVPSEPPSHTSSLGLVANEQVADPGIGGSRASSPAQAPTNHLVTPPPANTQNVDAQLEHSLEPVNLVEGNQDAQVSTTSDLVAQHQVPAMNIAAPGDHASPALDSQHTVSLDTNQAVRDEVRSEEETPAVHAHQVTLDTRSAKWKGLKELARVLGPATGLFGPIKDMVDVFVDSVDTYKMTEAARAEYDEIQVRIEAIIEDLKGYFQGSGSLTMTASMESICASIKAELEKIRIKLGKNAGARYLEAPAEADVILASYRRIELDLTRLSLNANWETLKGVKDQAISSRIDRLSPSLSARYNSAEADDELKRQACTPGTRVKVLENILDWAHGKGGGTIFWLNGMAGTGKTTISYSLCDKLNAEHKLAASFFCSRLREDCRMVKRIIPSIAYQLARFSLPFLSALSMALEKDLDVHSSGLHVQFEELIAKPLHSTKDTLAENLVIVIDALDECDSKESTGRMLDILLSKATDLPVRFLVSSRPESEIYDRMTEIQAESRLVLHELDKGEVQVDIEMYLRAELARMNPMEEQIAALVEKAGMLFIYAATAVRYIGYDNFQCDPDDRLNAILAGSESQEDGENEEIDRLYTAVLQAALGNQRLRKVERDNMRQVLHTVICARDPLTVSGLSELLQIHNTDRVRAVLRPLWSVLHIIGESELVTTLHASFPDFMFNPSRSKAYSCDSGSHNHTLAEHCFSRIKRAKPSFNICGLESAYLPDRLVPDIEQRVVTTISSDLFYACRYWADHFGAGKYTATLVTQLQDFISTRLLLWMEVLNLRKQMAAGTACMKLIIDRCGQSGVEDKMMDLLHDAQRFVDTFASNPVSQSTPHIYVSMLAFWPKATPIAEHYAHLTHGPVSAEGTALDQRQLARLATWTFDEPVNDIATSPDGRHIALAVDTNVLVVDASSGQVTLGPLHGHSEIVRSVIFSPDQSRVISGSWYYNSDVVIVGWDTGTGHTVLGPLQLDGKGYMDFLMFSPECTCILTGSSEGLRMWHAENGKLIRCLTSEAPVESAAFSPDGTRVAAKLRAPNWDIIGLGYTLQIWSIQNGDTTLGPLSINGQGMVVFSPDNSHIASVEGSVVHVRDVRRGDIVHQLHHPHGHGSRFIKYAPDGSRIVSFSYMTTIVVWDVHTGEIVLGPLEGHAAELQSIASPPDGSYFISAHYDGRVCKWNARQYSSTPESNDERSHEILSIKFSPDGKRFASGSADGTVSVWDAYTGEILVGPLEQHINSVRAVDFSNDHIASVSDDGAMFVFDALTGEVVLGPIQAASNGIVRAIAYSPGGSLIATALAPGVISQPGGVDLWDAQTGARVLSLSKIPNRSNLPVFSIQFSPDGTRIVGSGSIGNQQIAIWDVLTGQLVLEFGSEHTNRVFSVSYSPNGTLVASGSGDRNIILWDAYTGTKKLGPLTGHTGLVDSVSFSPDNSHLVSSSNDKTIRIWDVQTGEMVFELPHGHENGIRSVAYSPDGTCIISRGRDMSVRVHDARSTEERAAMNSTTEYGEWTMNKHGPLGLVANEQVADPGIGGSRASSTAQAATNHRVTPPPANTQNVDTQLEHSLEPVNLVEGDQDAQVPTPSDHASPALDSQHTLRLDTNQAVRDEVHSEEQTPATQAHRVILDARSAKWKGLKELARVLGPATGLFGPVKDMVDVFVESVDTYKMTEAARAEYEEIQVRIEAIIEDLKGYFQGGGSLTITASMEGICASIKAELEKIRINLGKNVGARYLEAPAEADLILASYRRIELDLTRLSLNANWETLKGVKYQAMLESAYLPDRLVPDIEERAMSTIPSDLFYACRYWADHFGAGKYTATLITQLRDFVSTRLLLWMEVLNLRKQMAAGMECMKLIIDWCGSEIEDELMDLLHDAQRFVDTFASNPVSQSTPHIYVSMLAFWPKATPIAEHYAYLTHGPVSAEGPALDQQQLARLATWSFDQPIKDIATSPDGRQIALAVGTNVLVVDASSGQVTLGPLHGHSGTVRSVMFSPDQSRIISGSWGYDSTGAVIVGWDTRTGDTVLGPLQLDGHTGLMTFLMFSPECTRIVTGSYGEGVRVWDAENGKMHRCLKSGARAESAAFSSDGSQVAATFWVPKAIDGSHYLALQVWSIQSGDTTLGPLSISEIGMIAFSPDNSYIASANQFGAVVCVRDAQTSDILHRLHHPDSSGLALIKYVPDGSQIVSVGYDRTIVVWDVHTGEIVLGPLEGHTGQITSIAFSLDGSYIISACLDGRVCKWNARQYSSTPHSASNRPNEILSVKFSPDGDRFASGSKDGTVCVWDAYTGEIVVGPIEGHTAAVNAVDFLNDHVASVSNDGAMCVFSALSGGLVLGPIQVASERNATAIAYSPGGSLIATASAGGLVGLSGVNLWDAQTGARVLGPLKSPNLSDFSLQFYSIQFSPDGIRIVGSGLEKNWQIVVWDTLTGQFVSEFLNGHTSDVFSLSYSPNGALVASGSMDNTIFVWDACTSAKKLGPLTGHTDWVNSVSFSPENSHLVSGSKDRTIRIWDVQTGEIVFELLHGHEHGIRSVAYSPDGTRILSLCEDGSVRIHDARSTKERVGSYVHYL
ncbi:Notchless protein homolog 1 [Xenopus laevis] [Rhizoctonia solani]|uniref:Notchless protein homolog 1 [Xenopus laevis] n=1 Tax=Rhizoctonia solani TaxID=456999 RepID=A0A0K6FV98_9AGAM|nr:Notchless protein homolog 1 [Xenopus laevis] [Rhizoctonia solani]